MIRRPPISTRTDTLFPYTTLFRSELQADVIGRLVEAAFKYQIEAKKPVLYADRLALEYRTILVGVDRLPRRRQQRSGTDEKTGMVVANRHKHLIAQTFVHGEIGREQV